MGIKVASPGRKLRLSRTKTWTPAIFKIKRIRLITSWLPVDLSLRESISDLCRVDSKRCSGAKALVAGLEGQRSNWIRGHLKRK